MSTKESRPTVFSIVKSDYSALLSFLFPLVMWGFWLIGSVPSLAGPLGLKTPPSSISLIMVILVTLLCIPLLVMKIRWVYRMYDRGTKVAAEVTSLWFHKDRGRVELRYLHDGQEYRSGAAIMKNRASGGTAEGDTLEILVDPEKPDRFIIPSFL